MAMFRFMFMFRFRYMWMFKLRLEIRLRFKFGLDERPAGPFDLILIRQALAGGKQGKGTDVIASWSMIYAIPIFTVMHVAAMASTITAIGADDTVVGDDHMVIATACTIIAIGVYHSHRCRSKPRVMIAAIDANHSYSCLA